MTRLRAWLLGVAVVLSTSSLGCNDSPAPTSTTHVRVDDDPAVDAPMNTPPPPATQVVAGVRLPSEAVVLDSAEDRFTADLPRSAPGFLEFARREYPNHDVLAVPNGFLLEPRGGGPMIIASWHRNGYRLTGASRSGDAPESASVDPAPELDPP